MIRMRVSEAAGLLDADYTGQDGVFEGCGIDSRTLPAGAIFVALPGQHGDGHDFVGLAAAGGAAAVMVERKGDYGLLPVIEVRDCRHALGRLAGIWRGRFDGPLIAVTGSNGKTTVKELLATILGGQGPVHATRGNLNNDLGVPLTLLGLAPTHRWAVVEMGANHPQEIAGLTRISRPTVGVITRCAPAHLEGFGTIEGVARAKGELFENLDSSGAAIINADDPYADLWRELAGNRRKITFGLERPADVSADYRLAPDRIELTLKTPIGRERAQLRLPGRHNVHNALAATAAAIAVGCPLEAIGAGLSAAGSIKGRLQLKHAPNGARIIDDTYNANPDSLAAALSVLAQYKNSRWLVLGDMGELGEQGPQLHRQAGALARELGITRLFATGNLCRHAVESFGSGGHHREEPGELLATVRAELAGKTNAEEVTILVKGSRSLRMERIVEGLLADR
uniref:UDP-N-acetylmuramoyl-tripeptide--D-alanyl-D-alanine ligase n=1 Tax=Candidatus Kentrum sp. DK TaxID=2126562 RepID=A0A450RUS0_9GAMM|nr:MAG: UDP-N-acetylmuramoyl-tripeptide--D-alanyl-D-alanine ligase [Candidatus Kentron sp. DK]